MHSPLLQINQIMKALTTAIPTFKWLLVLPQLTSRIVHPESTVQELTQQLVGRLLDSFPQQGLWSLVAVCRSSDRARKVRPGMHAAVATQSGCSNVLLVLSACSTLPASLRAITFLRQRTCVSHKHPDTAV